MNRIINFTAVGLVVLAAATGAAAAPPKQGAIAGENATGRGPHAGDGKFKFQPCDDGSKPTCNGKPLERGVHCKTVPLCADGTDAKKPPHHGKKDGGNHDKKSFGKDLKDEKDEYDDKKHQGMKNKPHKDGKNHDRDHKGDNKSKHESNHKSNHMGNHQGNHGGDHKGNRMGDHQGSHQGNHKGDRQGPKPNEGKPDFAEPAHEKLKHGEGPKRMDFDDNQNSHDNPDRIDMQQQGHSASDPDGPPAMNKIDQSGHLSKHNRDGKDAEKRGSPGTDQQGKGEDGEGIPRDGSSMLFVGVAAVGGILAGIAGTLLWNFRRNRAPAVRRASAVMVVDASTLPGTGKDLLGKDVQTLTDPVVLKDVRNMWGASENV